jgi:HSP20 family molecular chaperone IbpA
VPDPYFDRAVPAGAARVFWTPETGLTTSRSQEGFMTRLSLFNSPFLLGFDELERALDRSAKASSDGYPPYNIEQTGPDGLRITLAVAGFGDDDLSVTVEDRQLVIRGKQKDDPERVYLHRGIAARQFQRAFVLAEGIEVTGAGLDNGLLHVELVRPKVESRHRVIEIKASGRKAKPGGNRTIDVASDSPTR